MSVEARLLTPMGAETLRWSALFESEAPFLQRVVTSTLPQHEMAQILTGVIRAIADSSGEGCATVDLELGQPLFDALGLGDGVCVALRPETALQP